MALDNLISISFTPVELAALDAALTSMETTFAGKVINLDHEENQRFGKLGPETENWVGKVRTYMGTNPTIVPAFLSVTDLDADLAARAALRARFNRLQSLFESADDTMRLIGADIWNASLSVYNNVKYLSRQNVPGTTSIYDDLKQQFPGRPPKP